MSLSSSSSSLNNILLRDVQHYFDCLLKVAGQKHGPKNYFHWPPIKQFKKCIILLH